MPAKYFQPAPHHHGSTNNNNKSKPVALVHFTSNAPLAGSWTGGSARYQKTARSLDLPTTVEPKKQRPTQKKSVDKKTSEGVSKKKKNTVLVKNTLV